MSLPPLMLRYDGEGAFQAPPPLARICDKELVIGESYRFERMEARSMSSHGHWFACVETAFANLNDSWLTLLPTPEALRKYVLIAVGYCDVSTFVASSNREAIRMAAYLRTRADGFVLVEVRGKVITSRIARSQALSVMNSKEFQKVKELGLAKLAEMIGVAPETLAKNSNQAA